MAVGDCAGEWAFGDNCHASTHISLAAGERAIHEAKNIIWRESVYLCAIFKDEFYTQAAPPYVFLSPFLRNRFELDFALGQVNVSDTIRVTSECHRYLLER